MGRGRKKIIPSNNTNWEKVFYHSVGTYVNIINLELRQNIKPEPLRNHIKIIGGYAFKSTEYKKRGIPVIRISDFNNEQIILADTVYYPEIKELEKFELNSGNIIIALTGGTIGKLAIVQKGLGKLYLNQRVGKFEVIDEDIFETEYIYWIARSVQQIIKDLAWGAAIPNVSPKQIESLEFPFPPKEIQKGIITFLNDLKNDKVVGDKEYFNKKVEDKILSLHNYLLKVNKVKLFVETQLNLLTQLRQSFLREAMQGKLLPQNPNDEPASVVLEKIKAEKEQLIKEKKLKKTKTLPPITADEIPYILPKNWEWCKLGDITEIRRGKSPKYDSEGIPLMLNQKCVRWYFISTSFAKKISKEWFKSVLSEYKTQIEDLLVNSTGDGTIGRAGLIDKKSINYIYDSHILNVRSSIVQKYLCYFINSDYGQLLVANSKGATSTKQTELGVTNLSNFITPLPPLEEQQRIVAKLEQLMAYCDTLEENIRQSQQQTQALLQVALKEALQPKAESANKKVAVPTQQQTVVKPQPSVEDLFFKRACLAAEITYQLHTENTFGHTKLQKLQFLCEHAAKMNLQNHYVKAAAGPYDYDFMNSIDNEFAKQGWFIAKPRENSKGIYYTTLATPKGYKTSYQHFFNAVDDKIQHLIDLFRNQKTDFCEVIATFYAVWVDLKTNKQEIIPDSLIANFYKWHEKKERFNRKYLVTGIQWMIDKGVYPK
ncbi:MAG: restriction endonuclease subunit S [bacterium]